MTDRLAAPCVICNGAGTVASCPSCRLAFAPDDAAGDLCPFCNSTPFNLSICGVCGGDGITKTTKSEDEG